MNRNCAPIGVTPAGGAGDPPGGGSAPWVSVAICVPAGGEPKSLKLLVHLPPPWQVWQPALKNKTRPSRTAFGSRPMELLPAGSSDVVSAPLGVRTPNRTHSFIASSAGQGLVLPGSVTVSCGRP